MREWIPTKERRPKRRTPVLVSHANGGLYILYWDGKDKWRFVDRPEDWFHKDGVGAWQPLPEPYEERNHE